MPLPPLWAFTPAFDQWWVEAGHVLPDGVDLLPGARMLPDEKLRQLRQVRGDSREAIRLFDIGRLPDGRPWHYVADVVSKSGVNPLRGMGRLLKEPFVDVSRLYHLPAGASGLTITALGDRFDASSGVTPACGELHHLAILAHAESLKVTAVIVAGGRLSTLDPEEFLAD